MKIIGVIRKSCSPYASSITIVEVKKLNKTIKICLYNDITDFNKIMIKDTRPIPHQQMVFDRMDEAK